MVAKRMAEEEALSEQQKKRKAQVQFEAQYYTEEDWDAIRAKLEAITVENLHVKLSEESRNLEAFSVKFKEIKEEFDKLLEQETSKKQKIDIEDASITKGKDEVVKEEETEVPVKKTRMRRKQKARKR
ncbi:hypothetical protein Tco_0118291, partial [Tanacetum coccineum]